MQTKYDINGTGLEKKIAFQERNNEIRITILQLLVLSSSLHVGMIFANEISCLKDLLS